MVSLGGTVTEWRTRAIYLSAHTNSTLFNMHFKSFIAGIIEPCQHVATYT